MTQPCDFREWKGQYEERELEPTGWQAAKRPNEAEARVTAGGGTYERERERGRGSRGGPYWWRRCWSLRCGGSAPRRTESGMSQSASGAPGWWSSRWTGRPAPSSDWPSDSAISCPCRRPRYPRTEGSAGETITSVIVMLYLSLHNRSPFKVNHSTAWRCLYLIRYKMWGNSQIFVFCNIMLWSAALGINMEVHILCL